MQRITLALVLAVASVALAGCTGQFETRQTEPLRVQLEGTPVETEMNAQQTRVEREFVIVRDDTPTQTQTQTQKVTVIVNARQTSPTPPTMVIIIKERDTGRVVEQRQVVVQNQTVTNIDVDVRGRDNTVVVTQLNGGSAVVNVAAEGSTAATATDQGTATTGGNVTAPDTTMGNVTMGNETMGNETIVIDADGEDGDGSSSGPG